MGQEVSLVLGLHNSFTAKSHDSSATILRDGEVVAAIEEGRLSRRKSSVGYPTIYSIRECLKFANAKLEDISLVVSDGETFPRINEKVKQLLMSQFGYSPRVELINQAYTHSFDSFFPPTLKTR